MKKLLTMIAVAVIGITSVFGFTACSKKSAGADKVKLINVALGDEDYAFAMKKDNTSLQTSFNAYLTDIKNKSDTTTPATVRAVTPEKRRAKVSSSLRRTLRFLRSNT